MYKLTSGLTVTSSCEYDSRFLKWSQQFYVILMTAVASKVYTRKIPVQFAGPINLHVRQNELSLTITMKLNVHGYSITLLNFYHLERGFNCYNKAALPTRYCSHGETSITSYRSFSVFHLIPIDYTRFQNNSLPDL